MTATDYDALLASTERDIGIATIGRKDGLVTHTVEQAQALVDAIRALRAEMAESDRDARRAAALYKSVQRACAYLPEGFTMCIDLERGAGTVELQDENGEVLQSEGSYPLSVQIDDLIDEAIKSEAEMAAQEKAK